MRCGGGEGEQGYYKVGAVARTMLDQTVMTPMLVEEWGDAKWHCWLVRHDIVEEELLWHMIGHCSLFGQKVGSRTWYLCVIPIVCSQGVHCDQFL